MDRATWENLKQKGVKCESQKSEKKLFAYGQTDSIEVLGTFKSDIFCKDSRVSCVDEFTVVEGPGKVLLGKNTAEKLNVLRVGPPRSPQVYLDAYEGSDKDIMNDFKEIFSGVGKLKDFQMKLHIKDDVKPVAQPVRRLLFGLRAKVDKKLKELLEDIIEEVPSRPTGWISPLAVVPKPDGDIRICVDMRQANKAIERELHPILTIEEVLYELNGSTVYSKLDLKSGFHQVELEESSRRITTFVTHSGLYRYKRLMFRITSAPEMYQKIVKDVLIGCKGVANIADDLIIHGWGIEEHDKNLLTFFGHDLGCDGVSPNEEKVAAVRDAKPPKNAAEVRSFLGLVQYCAKFLPDFAQVAEPIRKLTRKNQQFEWGKAQQQSFSTLKDLLTQAETLAYFKNDCETRIIADAGPTGIGAVLTQLQGGYSQTEKEGLALVWACERFKLYVYGRKFELEMDHKPLQYIYNTLFKPSARLERWVLRLQGYHFKVVYQPGKTNIADALSRLNSKVPKDHSGETVDVVRIIAQESTPVALTAKEVERESEKDPELVSVRHYIRTGNWSESPEPMQLGRELKTKLPKLRPDKNILDETIRDRDWNKKVAGKEYADKHRQANQNPINPGDKVLKNSKTSGKLDPKFETKPYIVQTKGQELTVKSDEGVVYRQNNSFVKPYQEPGNTDKTFNIVLGGEGGQTRLTFSSHINTRNATELPISRPSRMLTLVCNRDSLFVYTSCVLYEVCPASSWQVVLPRRGSALIVHILCIWLS
ncbi:Hypothetical predicted protein, partial [Paramuricea clavata]